MASLIVHLAASDMDFDALQALIGGNRKELAKAVAALVNNGGKLNLIAGELTFDLDADPFLYGGESIAEVEGVKQHQKGGEFLFDGSKVELYLTKAQQSANGQGGEAWLKEQQNLSGFNATFIDCLFTNQDHPVVAAFLAPLQGKALFATKTVLVRSGYRYVRYLLFDGGRWIRYDYYLRGVWYSYGPALRPASENSDT